MFSANIVKTLFFDQIGRPFLTLSKHYRYKCKNNVYIMLTQCMYNVYTMYIKSLNNIEVALLSPQGLDNVYTSLYK